MEAILSHRQDETGESFIFSCYTPEPAAAAATALQYKTSGVFCIDIRFSL